MALKGILPQGSPAHFGAYLRVSRGALRDPVATGETLWGSVSLPASHTGGAGPGGSAGAGAERGKVPRCPHPGGIGAGSGSLDAEADADADSGPRSPPRRFVPCPERGTVAPSVWRDW